MKPVGKITYRVSQGKATRAFALTIGPLGTDKASLCEVRRRTLFRMLEEARAQGACLSYSDLSLIMLSSRATLKRDIRHLRLMGHELTIGRGRCQEGC